MKNKLVIFFSVIIFNAAAFAQSVDNSNVPPVITNAFNSTFSNANDVKWEMDYDNYVARFKNKKKELAVTYNKDGKWISTETPITLTSLPAVVKSALGKEFSVYKEHEIEKVDSHEGVNYMIDLEYNQKNYVVVISEKGELISNDEVREMKKEN